MNKQSNYLKYVLIALLSTVLLTISGCSEDQTSDTDNSNNISSFVETEMMPGATIVRRKCVNCHFVDKKMRKVGPGLAGIYMSKPTSPGLPFEVWDEEALNVWLTDPVAVKKNTPMAISGLRDPEVRAQVIDYLKKI